MQLQRLSGPKTPFGPDAEKAFAPLKGIRAQGLHSHACASLRTNTFLPSDILSGRIQPVRPCLKVY